MATAKYCHAAAVHRPTISCASSGISDPQVSPDGRWVAFTLRETDIEANRGRTDLWLLELQLAAPARPVVARRPDASMRPATRARAGHRTAAVCCSLSTRSGSSQLWRISLDGGEAQQVTDYPLDVTTFKVAPVGGRVALTMEVFPDCADLQCSADRLTALGKRKNSGLQYDELFVRQWDTWRNGTLSTLFTAQLGADGLAMKPVNVSGAVRANVPSKPNGGDEEYEWSRDGARLVFSARLADRVEAWSTNYDLYEVPAAGGIAPRNLTPDNPAWDTQPVFLANGDLALARDEASGLRGGSVPRRAARGGHRSHARPDGCLGSLRGTARSQPRRQAPARDGGRPRTGRAVLDRRRHGQAHADRHQGSGRRVLGPHRMAS